MISVLRIAERKEKKPLATINNCPNRQLPSLMINRMKLILAEGDPPSTSRRLTFRSRYSVFWFSALFCPQGKSIAMFLTSWPSLLPNLHLLNKPKGCEKSEHLFYLKSDRRNVLLFIAADIIQRDDKDIADRQSQIFRTNISHSTWEYLYWLRQEVWVSQRPPRENGKLGALNLYTRVILFTHWKYLFVFGILKLISANTPSLWMQLLVRNPNVQLNFCSLQPQNCLRIWTKFTYQW